MFIHNMITYLLASIASITHFMQIASKLVSIQPCNIVSAYCNCLGSFDM